MKMFSAVVMSLALLCGPPAIAQERGLTKIAGDVYRFQNKFHYSVVVITEAGVVVSDPINADAAEWLRSEVAKLTDQPITHLVYSHSHGDHASGGAAFGSVPNVIAHTNAPDAIDGVRPTLRVDGELTLEVGDKTLELTYLGPGHGEDMLAMVVRPENVGFVVDVVAAKRLPYRDFGGANVDDWITQAKNIESLEFDTLAGGHGPMGVKDDVRLARVYMEELRAEVLAGLKAGKSVDQLVQDVTMDSYRDWASYEQWRALNVQGMARHLQAIGAAN